VPTLLDDQRAALFADIAREREATLQALQQERALILGALTEERVAVMREIHAMYQGSLTSLKSERAAVLAELPSTVAESMQRSNETLRSLIDHLLLRIVQLLAAAAAVVGLGWLALSAWRRRHPGVAPRSRSHPHPRAVGYPPAQ